MENKHDNLEDLFRKSLENYRVPGLRPWEEEKKLLQERKQERRRRRWGYLPYLLTAVFLLGGLFYAILPDAPEPGSGKNTNGEKVKIRDMEIGNNIGLDTPNPTKKSYPMSPAVTTLKAKSREPSSLKKTGGVDPKISRSETKKNIGRVSNRLQSEIRRPNENGENIAGREIVNSDQLKESDVAKRPVNLTFEPTSLSKNISSLTFPERRINTLSTLHVPEISYFEQQYELKDPADTRENVNPRSKAFPVFYTGLHIGIDHLSLPRNDGQNIDFSNNGFTTGSSIGVSGIMQLSNKFMIRSGLSIHRFQENLNVDVNRTINDIVYSVKEKPGDIISTPSTREIQFDSSYRFSNRYTALSLPVLVGYTLPFGRGTVSVFTGVLAGFQLSRTAIASTDYRLKSEVVKDYANGMDPDLEGYIHYETYEEYTAEFTPIRSEIKPVSLLLDFRVMGQWPLKPNLNLAAEVSYAQGLTPFFVGNPRINPSLSGAKIGILYTWKAQRLLKNTNNK